MRIVWGFDTALIGTMACAVNDGTDSGTATVTAGTYCHETLAGVAATSGYTAFKTAVEAAFDAALPTFGASILYTPATMTYVIDELNGSGIVDFRTATLGDDSGHRLAAALGFNYLHGDASGGSSSDPYDIVLSGPAYYESNCRPYYAIIPTIEGRSLKSDEYEPDGTVSDAEADDGTAYYASKDGAAIWSDWTQMAETDTPPGTFSDPGLAVFKRSATAAVPWSYQHAWEHLRTGGSLPFLVVDGSDSEVCEMRADGASFRPTRFAGPDFPLWNVQLRTRLLGRL